MTLKAGVVQFSPLYGRVVDNLARLESLVAQGVRQGAQLLVLPEMAWTGYLWPNAASVSAVAEPAGTGLGQTRVRQWCRQWGITLVFGFPEAEGERVFNSQGIVTPDLVAQPVYRKTHLFEADEWWTVPGQTGYRRWKSPVGTVGSGICMDLNYPDLVEHHAAAETQFLAFSTNWLDQDLDIVPYWEEKLAGVNGRGYRGVALFANRGGEEYGVAFRGQSAVFVEGRCVASLPGTDDGVLVVDVPTP
jgi:predicted amidohydrolase